MAQKVTVDLASKIIAVKPAVTSLDAEIDLYSDLKEDWLLNANGEFGFEFPFRTIGGDPLGGGLEAGAYFFLRNDLGWRIRPQEANHELTITGNLFAEDTAQPIFVPTTGNWTVSIRLQTSSLTQLAGEILASDPITELSGAPPSAPTWRQAISWLYMQTRNLVRANKDTLKQQVTNDAGSVVAQAALSDDGTVFTRGKFVAP
jgi:hypothetical protein